MIDKVRKKFAEDLKKLSDKQSLEDLRVKYLGRKGELNKILEKVKTLGEKERAEHGRQLNAFKQEIEQLLKDSWQKVKTASRQLAEEWLDITAPGAKPLVGHWHPRTLVLREIENIFKSLGFSVVDGPELETQWYNFEALNMPKDHPARDMQDTFYVKNPAGGEDLVLRTHTSPNQIRFMEKNEPPFRIIVPGKVFRNEATDASHEYQLHQFEGLMVDKNISVANFKAIVDEFFQRLYGPKAKIRLRPSFFPFTEPSFEVDMACVFCDQKGCRVCKNAGWLEMGGAGMVNQFVFESAGYVRNEWQGFAFGFGIDRLAMLKYHINDIRLLTGGDMRFLKQF
ncbi:MAG: phenylalanine--tRNA ligase subunit alpha [Candidatus Portnoybacteria bacterium CG02_land_8_20_14_3_00_45_8]|uniref:Phenylalanine--tRNA ligase alpha subunit n=1 Tax=Candidatus Portnoybacteria bacterium CG02_land_8_20_14_3_00_45_8 TaxID=1974807 RepID=A0A2M7D638_9BACT|nr:MAG: phenylalanine--tRNA ligase subunit alpha [Candidatus Portnoybacteria bacterium CG02_land_8_20_14_3_00_45_8]